MQSRDVSYIYKSGVIKSATVSQIIGDLIFVEPFVQAQIKENIKPPCHCPLWGETTGDRWFPPHKGQVTRKMFPFDDVIMCNTGGCG